jgi:uncharacterized protein
LTPRPRRWHWPRRSWLLPQIPDVLGLLEHQGQVTIEGIEAFDRWANGDAQEADHVGRLEHDADDARRAVLSAVRQAFTTPIEPEDLFELSERLDSILNQAKDLVRESEVLGMPPDKPMAEMSHLVLAGVRELASAFPDLTRAPDSATAAADRAIHQDRGIERIYRQAMLRLMQTQQISEIAGRRELYRRYSRIGDAIEHVAHRIWYAVVKQA